MTYDTWKATNPADEFLGPSPEELAAEMEPPEEISVDLEMPDLAIVALDLLRVYADA